MVKIQELLRLYPEQKHAFIIIDLDDFKETNDTYGHLYGDLVLSFIAKKMTQIFPKESILCRLGGDEYSIFLPSITSKNAVIALCELLCETLRTESLQGYETAKNFVSCGICFYDKNTLSFDELYRKADIALYYGKKNGKNQCIVFANRMEEYASLFNYGEMKKASDPIENNIRELVFKTLFTSDASQFDSTLNHVLKMIALYFGGDHGFIVQLDMQNKQHNLLAEWVEKEEYSFRNGISSYPKPMIKDVFDLFECSQENMAFLSESKFLHIPYVRKLLSFAKVKTLVMMKLHLDDVHTVIIGYCHHSEAEIFNRRQKDDFKTLFEIIEIFLKNHNQKLLQQENLNTMMTLLDHIGYSIYVIDPANYHIIYFNREIQKIFPAIDKGALCYQNFQKLSAPCANCPIHKLDEGGIKSVSTDIYNGVVNSLIHTITSYVEWPDGHRYILLSCIPDNTLSTQKKP